MTGFQNHVRFLKSSRVITLKQKSYAPKVQGVPEEVMHVASRPIRYLALQGENDQS